MADHILLIKQAKETANPKKRATIERMEAGGYLDPNCEGCVEFYEAADPSHVFAPPHARREWCRSYKGGRNHCTCDSCF